MLKLLPVIVTVAPEIPLEGVKPEIVGLATFEVVVKASTVVIDPLDDDEPATYNTKPIAAVAGP